MAKPRTTEEALGRQYSCDCWIIAGMIGNIQRMEALWGTPSAEVTAALTAFKAEIAKVWHEVKGESK